MITLESLIQEQPVKPEDATLTLTQLDGLMGIFKEFISKNIVNEEELKKLEETLNFTLGESTKAMLLDIGSFEIINGNFSVPNPQGLIELTNKWRSTVATDEQKSNYIVIEADGDDYTLVDSQDKIFVYSGETKKTEPDGTDVVTHICKHIMAKFVGKEYSY